MDAANVAEARLRDAIPQVLCADLSDLTDAPVGGSYLRSVIDREEVAGAVIRAAVFENVVDLSNLDRSCIIGFQGCGSNQT